MNRIELLTQLAEIFETRADQLPDEAGPNQIPGWDSMAALNVIFLLEGAGAGSIALEETLTLKTIGSILNFAKERGIVID